MNKIAPYHVREWLNPKGVYASSTITAFAGMSSFLGEQNVKTDFFQKKLTIHDCQQSIRLHQMPEQTDEEYITKIRLVEKVCKDFADYLESILEKEARDEQN